jgi:hypothetical protein
MGAIGLLYFARLPDHGTYVSDVLPTIAIVSIGMGLTFVPCTLLATTNVAAEDAGLASGLLNTSQQVGGALGLAILASLATSKTNNILAEAVSPITTAVREHATVSGYHIAFAVGAVMLVIGGLVLLVTVRKADAAAIDAGHAEPVLTD